MVVTQEKIGTSS